MLYLFVFICVFITAYLLLLFYDFLHYIIGVQLIPLLEYSSFHYWSTAPVYVNKPFSY